MLARSSTYPAWRPERARPCTDLPVTLRVGRRTLQAAHGLVLCRVCQLEVPDDGLGGGRSCPYAATHTPLEPRVPERLPSLQFALYM